MKRSRLLMVLAIGLVTLGAANFAMADLVTSPSQVINLHGKSDTADGIIAGFNQVNLDGSETPFTFPAGKILMVTRLQVRSVQAKKGAVHMRCRLISTANNDNRFFTTGLVGIYDSQSKSTLGNNLLGVDISPGIPIGADFGAVLVDSGEKVVVPAFLRVRIIGYLVDVPS
jgi:hypothetical protein